MTGFLEQLSLLGGEHLKEVGISAVADKYPSAMEMLESVILHLVRENIEICSDDVRTYLRTSGVHLQSPNVIGAAFSRAAKRGLIIQSGTRNSSTPCTHSRLIRTWRRAPWNGK